MYALLRFEGPLKGYVVNYIRTNGWKVEATQTRDDLLQDAYYVYLKIGHRYPDLDTPQHFMALFKTAWQRHFTDLANADTVNRALVPIAVEVDDEDECAEPVGDVDNDGALAVMIRQAPQEVKAVLNLFLSAPQEILDLAMAAWTGPDKRRRDGGCQRVNKMLGLPANLDALETVREYFH